MAAEDTTPAGGTPVSSLPTSPIRTLQGDIAGAIKHQNVSLAGIAIREAEARRLELGTRKTVSRKKTVLGIASAVILLAAVGTAGWFLFFRGRETPREVPRGEEVAGKTILIDQEELLDISGLRSETLRRKTADFVRNLNLRIGFIDKINFVQTVSGKDGAPALRPITTPEFFALFGTRPPERLPRFLENDFLFGIYSFKKTSAFLLFKGYSYQGVFAEMLAWERKLAEDIYPLLSGSPPPEGFETLLWRDEVIKNIDTRVLRKSDGTVLLMYSFLNTLDKLFIGVDQDAFTEVLTRLQTPRRTVQ